MTVGNTAMDEEVISNVATATTMIDMMITACGMASVSPTLRIRWPIVSCAAAGSAVELADVFFRRCDRVASRRVTPRERRALLCSSAS